MNYFKKHPNLPKLKTKVTGLEIIEKEYQVLSRAVHASAKAFRMTNKSEEVLLMGVLTLLKSESGRQDKS